MNAKVRRFCWTIALLATLCARTSGAQVSSALHAYETCSFDDQLAIVDVSSLAPGVTSRTVKTFKDTMLLKMVAGRRIMLAYPDTDFYANVKVEVLPAGEWAAEKQIVIDGFDYTLASSPESVRNYDLPGVLNGFTVQGFDRSKLEGGVLGMYLLLDDANHIVTTMYLLNQEPDQRKFQSIAEYARLRNHFLRSYTGCVRANLNATK